MVMRKISGKVMVNRHVMLSRLKSRWPFIAWLLAALLAVVIYFHGGQFGGMRGSVFTRIETAAPLTGGRLEGLFVDVGDSVKKGDLLAQMDPSVLEAEKALIEAQMRIMASEVKTEAVQNLRRFDASIIRLESELRDLRTKQVEAHGELAALRPEFDRLQQLFKSKLIDEQELMPVRMKVRAIEAIAKDYPVTIMQIEESLKEARKQKQTIAQQSDSAVELIQQETAGQVRLLDVQIEACTLRALEDGIVSRIYYYPGNMVPDGDTVLSSVVASEPRVIGFLSEYNARDVAPGMKAYLTTVSGYGPIIEAEVVALTPEIYSLPTRVSPIASQASRGRRVVLKVDPDCDLLPGEGVEIRFHRPWTTRLVWHIFGDKDKGGE